MTSWNVYTERFFSKTFEGLKAKRVALFCEALGLGPSDTILDLGSEDGSYLSKYYPYPENIVIADINEAAMKAGVEKFNLKGYKVINEDGSLPFSDKEFDAVWCNSVIEHVTLPKQDLGKVTSKKFVHKSNEHQQQFAKEIDRVGKSYFVQTPYIHFPVESHSWLPFIAYLPHRLRWLIGKNFKKLWIKQWTADFYLYDLKRFKDHFSNATGVLFEKTMFIPKALIAIKKKA